MNDIIKIIEHRPHKTGTIRCLICEHEYVLVTHETDELWFECPKCKTHKATWKYPCESKESHWQCNCGNFLFYLTPNRIYCPNCGMPQGVKQ